MKNRIIVLLLSLVVVNYTQELRECANYHTFEERNVCRQNVTARYRDIQNDEIEINIYHSPRIQKNVVNFKEVFGDENDR